MAPGHYPSTWVAAYVDFWRNYLDVVEDCYGIPDVREHEVGDILSRVARLYSGWWSALIAPGARRTPTNPWPGVPLCCFVFDDTSNTSRKEGIPLLQLPRRLRWVLRNTKGDSDDFKDYVHARIVENFIEIHIRNARTLPIGEYFGVIFDDEPNGPKPPICTILVCKTHATAPPPAAKSAAPKKKARARKKKAGSKKKSA